MVGGRAPRASVKAGRWGAREVGRAAGGRRNVGPSTAPHKRPTAAPLPPLRPPQNRLRPQARPKGGAALSSTAKLPDHPTAQLPTRCTPSPPPPQKKHYNQKTTTPTTHTPAGAPGGAGTGRALHRLRGGEPHGARPLVPGARRAGPVPRGRRGRLQGLPAVPHRPHAPPLQAAGGQGRGQGARRGAAAGGGGGGGGKGAGTWLWLLFPEPVR